MAADVRYSHAKEISAMLRENAVRRKRIFGTHSQVSGRGLPFHTHRVRIPDYGIKEEWLTDEAYNNELYQRVIRAGSISAFVSQVEAEFGEQITHEQVCQALLLVRCSRDPWFAFAVIFTIKDKRSGRMVPFMLNYPQLIVLDRLEDMRRRGVPIRLILLKARQWGGSTLVDLYIAWIQLFVREGWNAVILAQTKDTARRIRAMYEKALEAMPGFLFGVSGLSFAPYKQSASDSVVVDEHRRILRNNTITVASYENFESTRGADYAMAHFSEVAFWRTTETKSAEGVITNIDSNITLEPCTVEVFESTANGQTGYFYDECQLAKRGKSIREFLFVPFFYIANDMLAFRSKEDTRAFTLGLIERKDESEAPDETSEPGRFLWSLWEKGATLEHINWYVMKRRSFHDHGAMAQEAPSDDIECFVYSGSNVFSPYLVDLLKQEHCCEPSHIAELQIGSNGNIMLRDKAGGRFKVWRTPDKVPTRNQYIVSVDLGGRSDKSDFSCITVIDRLPTLVQGGKLEVVARWHGHYRYDHVAELAMRVARYYKNALLVIESNSYDRKKADASQYVEMGDHIRGALEVIGDSYDNLYCRPATSPEDLRNGIYVKKGFQTNVKTKQEMVDHFIPLFEDNNFIDHDEIFYHEASIYEEKPNGGYGNKEGKDNHDDVLMTDMIACLVEKDMPKPSIIADKTPAQPRRRGTINESSF